MSDLNTSLLLSDTEVQQFAEQGFLIVRGLADAAMRNAVAEAARAGLAAGLAPVEYEADLHYPGSPESREAEGGRTIRRLLQVYQRDEAFRHWAHYPAMTTKVRQLLGGKPIALTQAHHNSLMTKQPSYSSKTLWHRDIRYWSFKESNLVSVWLALGREFPENGCLGFIPGSHRVNLPAEYFDERTFLRTDLPESQRLIATAVFPSLDAGDVVFFHSATFHAAGNNQTTQTKLSLVMSYHTQDNEAIPGTRTAAIPAVRIG